MKIIDAYILARTKRGTRRIRTVLVVVVSSLLFAVLFFSAMVGSGVLDAGAQLKNIGFNGRNMVSVGSAGGSFGDFKAITDKIHADMDGELKARHIKVTDTTQLDPSYQAEFARRIQVFTAQIITDQRQQLEAATRKLGKPTALYHFAPLDVSSSAVYQSSPSADPYADQLVQQQASGGVGQQSGDPSLQFQFFSAEQDMLRTQLQPGQSVAWQPGQPYPLYISYAYLEKLAGRSFAKVDAAKRNAAYRQMMRTYAGTVITFCDRNQAAQEQLQEVVTYNYKALHDTDASTKPIDLPVCAGFDQKLLKKLGIVVTPSADDPKPLFATPTSPDPVAAPIHFKIVGFVPSTPQFSSGDVINQLLTSVSQLPGPPQLGIVPAEVVDAEPLLRNSPTSFQSGYSSLFADFRTRADEKAFLAQGCAGNECGNSKNTKPFLQAFGSVSFALEGVFHSVRKFVLIGLLGIVVIAALLIMFTISKVIADSTKEIAVFRSLGARRRDIAHIYYTYGMMLAVAALVCSAIFAAVGAAVVSSLYKDRIASSFVQVVGAYNTDMHVSLLGLNWLWLAGVAGAMAVAALLGITVPILASLRRKLITILREE